MRVKRFVWAFGWRWPFLGLDRYSASWVRGVFFGAAKSGNDESMPVLLPLLLLLLVIQQKRGLQEHCYGWKRLTYVRRVVLGELPKPLQHQSVCCLASPRSLALKVRARHFCSRKALNPSHPLMLGL